MESTRRERYEESELENDYLVDKDGNHGNHDIDPSDFD